MSIWTGLFWKDLAERLIATLAQVALGVVSASAFTPLGFDWTGFLITLVVAGAAVVLKALAANAWVSNTVSPASLAHDERGL